MEIRFDKKYLEELYLEGKASGKKHRFQPSIVAKYRKTIDLLESVAGVEDMATVRFGYTPTHPGEVLKDEIEYRKISQRKLAEQMGISYKALNDLLNGRRTLTTPVAMMFEAALDIPADSLMRLQLKYNMQQASNDQTLMERLNKIRKYAALL